MNEIGNEAWQGPFYELYVEFGDHSSERLAGALEVLWQDQTLSGPYMRQDVEFSEQSVVPAALGLDPTGDSPIHLYGMARLPDASRVVCGSVAHVRLDGADEGLTFYLPWGALEELGRDFEQPSATDSSWWSDVDSWLARLGREIFECAPFAVAAIGPEWLTWQSAAEIRRGHLVAHPPGLLIPADGALSWVPMPGSGDI